MNFTQKRTCKGCFLEGDVNCEVKKEFNNLKADKPLEPCYKPISNHDFHGFDFNLQKADLEIFRATQK